MELGCGFEIKQANFKALIKVELKRLRCYCMQKQKAVNRILNFHIGKSRQGKKRILKFNYKFIFQKRFKIKEGKVN